MSNFNNVSINDKVKTWCAGKEVTGKVTYRNEDCFIVDHEPVTWGKETYTQTIVRRSTPLQKMFYSETTPYFEPIEETIEFTEERTHDKEDVVNIIRNNLDRSEAEELMEDIADIYSIGGDQIQHRH